MFFAPPAGSTAALPVRGCVWRFACLRRGACRFFCTACLLCDAWLVSRGVGGRRLSETFGRIFFCRLFFVLGSLGPDFCRGDEEQDFLCGAVILQVDERFSLPRRALPVFFFIGVLFFAGPEPFEDRRFQRFPVCAAFGMNYRRGKLVFPKFVHDE